MGRVKKCSLPARIAISISNEIAANKTGKYTKSVSQHQYVDSVLSIRVLLLKPLVFSQYYFLYKPSINEPHIQKYSVLGLQFLSVLQLLYPSHQIKVIDGSKSSFVPKFKSTALRHDPRKFPSSWAVPPQHQYLFFSLWPFGVSMHKNRLRSNTHWKF